MRKRLIELAQEKPRYGYRRLWVLIRWEGEVVNHKRLFRIYRAAGLSVKRRKRKRLTRVGLPAFHAAESAMVNGFRSRPTGQRPKYARVDRGQYVYPRVPGA